MMIKILGLLIIMCRCAIFSSAAQDVGVWASDQDKETGANKGIAVVTGHGEVLPEGVRVRLVKWEDGHGDFVATDTIANGKFRFELPVEEGMTTCSLIFDYYAFPSMIHKLYLTPGAKVDINAVDNYMFTWPVKSNVPEQAEYELFVNSSKDLLIEQQVANIEYNKTRNMDLSQKCDSIYRLRLLRDLELLKTRPISAVWLDKAKDFALMSHRLNLDTEDLKSMYVGLDDSIKNSQIGKSLYGHLYPESPIVIGDHFPDTEFQDIDGNTHKFSEFHGKWCLVDFWNSGCAPCLRALPELRGLKEKYPEMLELVSLSVDSESMWRKASENIPLTGNNWNEGKENYGLFRRLGTHAYPTFLVVTPDGTIKDIWVGYDTGKLKQKMSLYLSPKDTIECAE